MLAEWYALLLCALCKTHRGRRSGVPARSAPSPRWWRCIAQATMMGTRAASSRTVARPYALPVQTWTPMLCCAQNDVAAWRPRLLARSVATTAIRPTSAMRFAPSCAMRVRACSGSIPWQRFAISWAGRSWRRCRDARSWFVFHLSGRVQIGVVRSPCDSLAKAPTGSKSAFRTYPSALRAVPIRGTMVAEGYRCRF